MHVPRYVHIPLEAARSTYAPTCQKTEYVQILPNLNQNPPSTHYVVCFAYFVFPEYLSKLTSDGAQQKFWSKQAVRISLAYVLRRRRGGVERVYSHFVSFGPKQPCIHK